MPIALTITGSILALLLVFLALLVFWPMTYGFVYAAGQESRFYIACRTGRLYRLWIDLEQQPPVVHLHTMGLHLEKALPRREARAKGDETAPAPTAEPAPGLSERLGELAEMAHLWTDTRLLREIWLLFKDLIRIANPDRIKVKGRFGFDNPEHTGYLFMLTIPLLNRDRRLQLDLEPVWGQEHLELCIDGSGRIRLSSLLYRSLRFVANKKVRGKWREYRALKERQALRKQVKAEASGVGDRPIGGDRSL